MYYTFISSNMAFRFKIYAISKNNVNENDDVIKLYFYVNNVCV